MMRHERLNFHPLENTATTNIAREDLARFIRSCGSKLAVIMRISSYSLPQRGTHFSDGTGLVYCSVPPPEQR